jgi:hypothetical protein
MDGEFMSAPARQFEAKPAARSEEPLLLGMIGPPGGGKTLSSLRIAKGIQSVRGGDIVIIDTESGRSRKYSDQIPFKIVEMPDGARSEDYLNAIRAQLQDKPAAIIVDSLSDEHEAYLEWHDEMVPKMGGNDWAAWAKPKASRKRLINGILHIKTPLLFTFRAREKTQQQVGRDGKKAVVNIGWQPVAPLEIVHTLDLTCILPPRADGVPVWKSDKIGEDFIIKLPGYLKPFIAEGAAMSEEMGAAFARWAKGGQPSSAPTKEPAPDHAAASETSLAPNTSSDGAGAAAIGLSLEDEAREAAKRGEAVFNVFWKRIDRDQRAALQGLGEELRGLMKDADAT